jgi:hypothetical protein
VSRVAGRSLGDLWPYALIALLFFATSPYHAGLNNPNEMVRVYMTKAIVDHDTMDIDQVVREWGGVDDKAIRDGKLYSSKAPLHSLLGVPAYQVAKPLLELVGMPVNKRTITTVLRIFTAVIPGLIFAFVFLGFARRRALELGAPRALGTGLGIALAAGTMLYPYAITFTGHVLAAITAGGAYFAAVMLSRHNEHSRRWRLFAVLAGFLAGNAPFAEYPSALVALPALIGALFAAKTMRARAELIGLFAVGGLAPFAFGLWSHDVLWGSPFKTGYAFLENKSYVELHGVGFFGVGAPKWEAFRGSLFSPQTGLFFFSPILLVGLAAMIFRVFQRKNDEEDTLQIPRALAIAGFVGFVLSVLFISGHRGWRGGWTLGPRYIIAVAPLLGLWAVEAMRAPKMRSFVAAFGAVSILATGFAAALYPHLSDVYVNPLRVFLLPSYLRGEISYGIANALGLKEHAANAVHLVPLFFAMVFCALAGTGDETRVRRAIVALASLLGMLILIGVIPENDPAASAKENERLWGFWEPSSPEHRSRIRALTHPPEPPGLLFRGTARWREIQVEHFGKDGSKTACMPAGVDRCQYGKEGWQHFGPEDFEIDGEKKRLLFMHPIAGDKVRAKVVPARFAKRAVLRYGLSDASAASSNHAPVELTISRAGTVLKKEATTNERGLKVIELALTSTSAPLELELSVENDGARVFGFELELYKD